MLRLTIGIGLVCCFNPAPVSTDTVPRVLVLPYDSFGPQALSFGLIGFAWWQWEGGGSFEPAERFDVRVVVHRDGERGVAEVSHPTVPGVWDRRYVSRSDALAFIDRSVAELVEAGGFDALVAELGQTRAAFVEALPQTARDRELRNGLRIGACTSCSRSWLAVLQPTTDADAIR